jgi:hypothetical protein
MTNRYVCTIGDSFLQPRYEALLAAFVEAERCSAALKTARGDCPRDLDRTNPKHRNRELEYERAYLRLMVALQVMTPLLQPVGDAAAVERSHCDLQGESLWYGENRVRANNVMAAEQLYDAACRLQFAVIGVLDTPHFYSMRDGWQQPRPERFFVVCGRPGNELADFIAKRPEPPYMTREEADAEVNESLGNSGFYRPHVYDVRHWDAIKEKTEATRNPQPTGSQQAQLPMARRRIQRVIDDRKRQVGGDPLERSSIVVDLREPAIAMCIARELRQKGWDVMDYLDHGYSSFELWISGDGERLDV